LNVLVYLDSVTYKTKLNLMIENTRTILIPIRKYSKIKITKLQNHYNFRYLQIENPHEVECKIPND